MSPLRRATPSPSPPRAGVGLDSTTANSATRTSPTLVQAGTRGDLTASYVGYPGLGRHYLAWLEWNNASSGTTNWIGDNGDATTSQTGIAAEVMA
jgi:hypothetical protein